MKPTEGWSRTWTPVPRKDQRKVTSDGQTTAPRPGMACWAWRAGQLHLEPAQDRGRSGAALTAARVTVQPLVSPVRGEHPARPREEGAAGPSSSRLAKMGLVAERPPLRAVPTYSSTTSAAAPQSVPSPCLHLLGCWYPPGLQSSDASLSLERSCLLS